MYSSPEVSLIPLVKCSLTYVRGCSDYLDKVVFLAEVCTSLFNLFISDFTLYMAYQFFLFKWIKKKCYLPSCHDSVNVFNVIRTPKLRPVNKMAKSVFLHWCQDNFEVWNIHTAYIGLCSRQFLPSIREEADVKAKNVFWKYCGFLIRIKHHGSWTTKDVRKLSNHSHVNHIDLCRHELQFCFPHLKQISQLPNVK